MRTETLCRALLEKMLNVKLPKVRPKWLVNPTTKRCLELDMYAEDIKLAFEVDGAQHDVYTPHFHSVHIRWNDISCEQKGSMDHFKYRRLLDQLKNELCRERGVLLLRIPTRYHVSFRCIPGDIMRYL